MAGLLWLLAPPALVLAAGDPAAPKFSPASGNPGALYLSLQQEARAAADRGRAWLVAVQNADGSWGSLPSARRRLTAMATLVLSQGTAPDEAKALERARPVLKQPAVATTNATEECETRIWQELAMQVTAGPDNARTAGLLRHLQATQSVGAISSFGRMLAGVAAPSLALPPASMATNDLPLAAACLAAMTGIRGDPAAGQPALARLAAQWPPPARPPPDVLPTQQSWILARFINLAGGGTLADGAGRIVNWRSDLANELVATQQIDVQRQGTGFWTTGAAPDAALTATLYALMALGEL